MDTCQVEERIKQSVESLVASSLWQGICKETAVAIKASVRTIGMSDGIPHVQLVTKTAPEASRLEILHGAEIRQILNLGEWYNDLSLIEFVCLGELYG